MTLNRVKLGRAVTFMKYFAILVFLIFLQKTLIWNKVTLTASHWSNFAELVANEPMKNISKKNLPIFLFLFNLSLLFVKVLRAYN